MGLQWFDFVGLAGVLFVLAAFFLLQAGKLGAYSLGYQLANLFGAIFILVSLYHAPNVAAILLQLAWIAISLYGLWRARFAPKAKAGNG